MHVRDCASNKWSQHRSDLKNLWALKGRKCTEIYVITPAVLLSAHKKKSNHNQGWRGLCRFLSYILVLIQKPDLMLMGTKCLNGAVTETKSLQVNRFHIKALKIQSFFLNSLHFRFIPTYTVYTCLEIQSAAVSVRVNRPSLPKKILILLPDEKNPWK